MTTEGLVIDAARMQEAVARTRDALKDDSYVLVENEQRDFLGEALLLSIAGKVVAAFLRGVTKAAEGRIEEWGQQAGEWLFDRVESVFSSTHEPADSDVNDAATAVASVAGTQPSPSVASYADESERILRAVLTDRGMTAAAAERVAATTRRSALAAVGL
jgi:hypothetical protein